MVSTSLVTQLARTFQRPATIAGVSLVLLSSVAVWAQDTSPAITLPDANETLTCQQQLRAENYSSAVEAASVALSQSAVTSDPDRQFGALVCRARAYEGQATGEAAEKDYREALRIADKHFEAFDTRLVEPLTQLGRLRFQAEDIGQSELLLLRARDITHRTAGIYNVQQKEILDDLTAVFARQDRRQQANRQQELRLKAARETYSSGPELVEALEDYARYNASVQRFPLVRQSLEEAVSILEDTYGENDPRLIETLKLRAQLYKLHPTISTPKVGEQAMQRVVDIYASQEFVDQVDLLNARTAMGDWYLQSLKFNKARRYYRKTVKQAIAEDVDPELLDSVYGAPKLIFFERTSFSVYGGDATGEVKPSGTITARYNVSARGRPQNIRFIEDTVGVHAMTDEIRKRIENAAYRPRFADGKPALTEDLEQRFDIQQSGTGGLSIGKIYAPVWMRKE